MAYVLAARWVAKEGEEEAVLEALTQLAGPSRAEPGCHYYQPCRDPENPRNFFIFELYDDPQAVDAHVASEHFQRHALGDAIPRLETRERVFYETLDV